MILFSNSELLVGRNMNTVLVSETKKKKKIKNELLFVGTYISSYKLDIF